MTDDPSLFILRICLGFFFVFILILSALEVALIGMLCLKWPWLCLAIPLGGAVCWAIGSAIEKWHNAY